MNLMVVGVKFLNSTSGMCRLIEQKLGNIIQMLTKRLGRKTGLSRSVTLMKFSQTTTKRQSMTSKGLTATCISFSCFLLSSLRQFLWSVHNIQIFHFIGRLWCMPAKACSLVLVVLGRVKDCLVL